MANGLLDSLPPGFSDWDDYDRYRKQTGPSMRPSYSNKFTEFLATNPVTGFLVPGAERFLQKGQKPNIWDVGIAAADVALPMIPLAGMVNKLKKGIEIHKKLYHGSPNRNLKEVSIEHSKQTWMPHVSATDSPLLAESFTKGEMGDKLPGKVYESEGNWKIIDIKTDEGRELWESLGKDPKRALDAGFDGVQFKNYEKIKIDNWYPEIDWKKVENAKEIQLFRNLKIK